MSIGGIARIRKLAAQKRYRLTLHGEMERDADQIITEELEEALLSPQGEIIEDYPNDPRGPSCLILGFTKGKLPIHILCGITEYEEHEMLIIITNYRPDSEEWIDWRIRREKKP